MKFGHLLTDTLTHMPAAHVLSDLDSALATRRLSDNVHTIAEIVAHMTFWQSWFLQRCRSEYAPMAANAAAGWPAVDAAAWEATRDRFLAGARDAVSLGNQPGTQEQPIAPAIEFPPLAEYTVRDALVHIATHNAHHLGQVITLRQLMGAWPPPSGSWTW